ncbi:DUF1376 domain-containing protein [Sinorhizobium psoraleae]|uniref:DUF1376 domain-containing protein n=1 Tax=Sinorhizobium psoraleae TaxID=520838 RepID=A0ABT4KI85_9HYPH|nr:DUF1376 domain-containing protein [Sinorhizobium psoraleae]MCZ4091676.1 DUF1376 domain-containing protein [Sinorhizobium psoraleae]
MTHLPWMPVYIGDELAETAHLTAEEYGAYACLKMHLWQHGRLPCEDERLARIARCGADRWQSVRDALWNLFEDDWRHPRLESLRVEAEETHRKRSEAGKKGGRPVVKKSRAISRALARKKPGLSNHNHNHNHNHIHIQIHQHRHNHLIWLLRRKKGYEYA